MSAIVILEDKAVIRGREFKVIRVNKKRVVVVPADALEGLKFSDIPKDSYLEIYRSIRGEYMEDYNGMLWAYSDGTITWEFQENPRFYRGYLPVDLHIKVAAKLAEKYGFKVKNTKCEETCYATLHRKFDPNKEILAAIRNTVEQILNEIKELNTELRESALETLKKKGVEIST